MVLRTARHTSDLSAVTVFYRDLLGLDIIGEFKGHDGYNGVFLGKQGLGWHLEFTQSSEAPDHKPDEDDLLVFYTSSLEEYDLINTRFKQNGVEAVEPRNPYWERNSKTYVDPDGFRVVVSIPRN
ncbi:MAG: prolyl endopeptidase [Crocinitomicaceae bacterium]|nr:prolyl endopeptidase [Crocinitomicaceae bacterium]|tara:strand:+ start:17998 stop:18372 length:375 start_codon:yes stop_codon:yes gene_type:complete